MIEYLDEIMDSSLFKGLTIEEVGKFLFNCDYSVEEYCMSEEFFPKENNIMFLIKGYIAKLYMDYDGNLSVTHMCHSGVEDIINFGVVDDSYFFKCKAINPTVVLYITQESFRKIIPETSEIKSKILNNILDTMNIMIRNYDVLTSFLSQNSVRNKILKFIDFQKNPPKGLYPFLGNKAELANILRVDYTSLCREIRKLSEEIPNIYDYLSIDSSDLK